MTDSLLQLLFKPTRFSRIKEWDRQTTPNKSLKAFPGFEAFKLPPPSVNEEVMKNINRNKSQINSEFFSGIEKFKVLLKRTLTPKHSFNDGELVTGEGKGYYCIFVWLSSPVREQLVTSLRFLCNFQMKITGFEDKFRGISLISRILSRRRLLELWESQSYAMLFYFR